MKKILLALVALLAMADLSAQVLKPRQDAFPWTPSSEKATIEMASTVADMSTWDKYPTYDTYVAMMQGYAQQFPDLCRLDTIGVSVHGRLILSLAIIGDKEAHNPEFFYSSTIHGDEVTGYYFMLHLIDTLLTSYGNKSGITELVNSVDIYINPLANPDGTYYSSNNTVSGSRRYNANNVDLNRNFPDPFGTPPLASQQVENTAMINYVSQHRFVLSANLHGGAEVMNYPWDSFTTNERTHPDRDWWEGVGSRFVDTTRLVNSSRFRDVNNSGVVAGGNWYVIPNGRQDYMNYVWGCHEITMELSTTKTLGTSQLKSYWNAMSHSLINYIREIFEVPNVNLGISQAEDVVKVFPNPTRGLVRVDADGIKRIEVFNPMGAMVAEFASSDIVNLSRLAPGTYVLRITTENGVSSQRVVKM